MNDIMAKAYFAGMHAADFGGSLWEETGWSEMRSITELDQIVLNTVTKYPGKSRNQIWFHIVDEHFMRYLESEYLNTVKRLVETKKISSPTFTSTKRWNIDVGQFQEYRNAGMGLKYHVVRVIRALLLHA